jgi:hypothetical protein
LLMAVSFAVDRGRWSAGIDLDATPGRTDRGSIFSAPGITQRRSQYGASREVGLARPREAQQLTSLCNL